MTSNTPSQERVSLAVTEETLPHLLRSNTAELQRTLWQMKNAGYFKNCNGIIFGRPLMIREDYETSFNETVYESLKDLKIPVICDASVILI